MLVSAVPDEEDHHAYELRCGERHELTLAVDDVASESDRPRITTPSTLRASDTSYDTSCAHVHRAEERTSTDAQPPTMKP
jgi:hypothetical protein